MRNHRVLIKLFLFTVLIATTTTSVIAFRKQDTSNQRPENQEGENRNKVNRLREPAGGQVYDMASVPPDPKTHALRLDKSRRYNRRDQYTPLTELPPDVGGVGIKGEVLSSPLPVDESNIIVVGIVVKAQPYLSASKSSIYSEFIIRVEETLKNDGLTPLNVGDLVVADREGGALRLPDGRIIRFKVGSQHMPRPGKRYVLFISRIHEDQDLNILMGYELRNGQVVPLTTGGPYEGDDEQNFLNKIRTAIAQPQQRREGGVQ